MTHDSEHHHTSTKSIGENGLDAYKGEHEDGWIEPFTACSAIVVATGRPLAGTRGFSRRVPPMRRGTPEHPKVAMLKSRLRLSTAHTVGILEMLWHWTSRYARRGDVGRYDDAVITEGIRDVIPPEQLIDALVEARFLDRDPEHRLVVHDWWEHADEYVHASVARAREFFTCGRAPKLRKLESKERLLAEAFYRAASPGAGRAPEGAGLLGSVLPCSNDCEPNSFDAS